MHDANDGKYIKEEAQKVANKRKVKEILDKHGISQSTQGAMGEIVVNMSFSKEKKMKEKSPGMYEEIEKRLPEMRCVQDADRLDAIGAIGVARLFYYGGDNNRPLYDPKAIAGGDLKQCLIGHSKEKLVKLKETMKTAKGQEMAEKRHDVMMSLLQAFEEEWM